MHEKNDSLAGRFEADRARLRSVAYRMLGSRSEADDAVQEAWLRLSRADAGGLENLGGWLTTVVARVCLDMLRQRKSRREQPLEAEGPDEIAASEDGGDPGHEIALADSVGLALLVVLETLAPAERVAFVLHDMFDLPFEEIAPIVGRSATAARPLASRARRRVRAQDVVPTSPAPLVSTPSRRGGNGEWRAACRPRSNVVVRPTGLRTPGRRRARRPRPRPPLHGKAQAHAALPIGALGASSGAAGPAAARA